MFKPLEFEDKEERIADLKRAIKIESKTGKSDADALKRDNAKQKAHNYELALSYIQGDLGFSEEFRHYLTDGSLEPFEGVMLLAGLVPIERKALNTYSHREPLSGLFFHIKELNCSRQNEIIENPDLLLISSKREIKRLDGMSVRWFRRNIFSNPDIYLSPYYPESDRLWFAAVDDINKRLLVSCEIAKTWEQNTASEVTDLLGFLSWADRRNIEVGWLSWAKEKGYVNKSEKGIKLSKSYHSEIGRKGGIARHAKSHQVKKYVFELIDQRKMKGKFKNVNYDSKEIANQVFEYSERLKAGLSSYNLPKTIANWLYSRK